MKDNNALSCNNSTAVSPYLPLLRPAEMVCSKAYAFIQYLPWKPSWGALHFSSEGLCALYQWYHPPVPGHFLSRCLTAGYNIGQLKQHLEKTNYIRNRTSVVFCFGFLLIFVYSKFQIYGIQQAIAAQHNNFLLKTLICILDLSQNAENKLTMINAS